MTKVEFTYPNNLLFDCNKCGLCCRDTKQKTRHILILNSEANDISAKNNIPIEDFAEQIKDKEPYCFEMKKPKEGKCFFLKNNQCSIYMQRPLICRFYPFELKFDPDKDLYVFDFTFECLAISKGKIVTAKAFEELFALAKDRLL